VSCDIYVKITGIEGDSTDSKHVKWIEISSFQTGITQLGGGSSSAQGSHGYGKCDHQDFSMMKTLDSASPVIAEYACTGKHIDSIEIELCRPTGDKTCFMKYTLEDAFITSVQTAGGAGGLPTETIAFRYDVIKYEYTPTDDMGVAGSAVKAGWSTNTNEKVAG
jgi:type VI secretion system secreted protein Hcp